MSTRQGRARAIAICRISFAAGMGLPGMVRLVGAGTWNTNGDGNWSTASNWSGGVPNAVDAGATFGGAINAPHVVTQNVSGLTVGSVDFNNANAYTISSGAMTFDVSSGNATISAEQGAHTISSSIALSDPLSYTGSGGGIVTLSGAISGVGAGITVAGGGLTIAGTSGNTYTGDTTVTSGTLRVNKFFAEPFSPTTTLNIGTGTTGPQNASIVFSNQTMNFGDNMKIVVNGSGEFDNGDLFMPVTSGVTMSGGSIVNCALQIKDSTFTTNASSDSATVSGLGFGLDFAGQTRNFVVADGSAAQDLVINTKISDGGIVKNGAGTMVLTNSGNNYTNPTTVNGGTLLLQTSLTTSASFLVQVSGHVELTQNGNHVIATNSAAALGGCQLDLKDNKMILHTQGVGTWNGSIYVAGVSTFLQAGRNHGNWDGAGIITSMTAANAAHQLTTLAVATAAQCGKTTFAGQSVSPTDVLVMYTYSGDANLDGKVNADDYFQIDSHYINTPDSAKSYFNGDFNYDGKINGDDYTLIDNAFAAHGPTFSSGAALGGVTAVPEPAFVGVLAWGATLLMRRRRGDMTENLLPIGNMV